MDSTALNYNPLATCDDGSCVYCIYGCMDTTQFNYNPLATCDDGTCIPIIYGCTDSTAINYYSAANTNNGTCVYCTYGCTDPLATNYNASATCDDGSCAYTTCNSPVPTGLSVTDLTHDRAKVNWASSNTSLCLVEMYRVQYREQGATAWSTKTALGSGLCNFGLTTTSKMLWNLTPSTVYEYRAKAWYCSASASTWSSISTFTTLDPCPNVLNLAVSSGSNTQATFSWTAPTAPYSFVRIKLRVDSVGSAWFTAGGFGVMYPALTRNKNGLTPGQTYRASSRTWCSPSGGAHKALVWTVPIFWTQPGTLIRIDSENSSIENLTIYPNPSRDVFNISFVSEEKQNLRVRILNVIGEEVYKEDLQQFIGEYVKSINLEQYNKAIYFLEIETDDGVITKKLILQ
jgi:hypothetical protein